MGNPPAMLLTAFRCIQAAVAYRTSMVMAETSKKTCFHGNTFFGRRMRAKDGSLWLFVESNNLFLPLVHPEEQNLMFEEVHYTCTLSGNVQARNTPKLSDTCEVWVKKGQSISALPAPEHPGWLITHNKVYYPMNNPRTGEAIFEAFKATSGTGDVEQGPSDTEDVPTCDPALAAFRCIQAAVAYRTSMIMAETSERTCFHGDTFFGRRVTTTDGSLWLYVESNNLFLPLVHPEELNLMFEEVHYTCTLSGSVQARNTPKLSDTCEVCVKNGQRIPALPVPEHPGWLIAHNKVYYPMNNPRTGEAIFEAFKATAGTDDVEQGPPETEDVPTREPVLAAFRCIQSSVAYRTSMVMAETSERTCFHGDTFFGRRITTTEGLSWLFVESNNLFLPLVHPKKKTQMFEEVHYICTLSGSVQARNAPKLSDTCEVWVKKGQSISALPAPEHPGWLITHNKVYYPMNNPRTGEAIFEAFKATAGTDDVEQGRPETEDDPTNEQLATVVSVCVPCVGFITCCINQSMYEEGSEKRKWGYVSCLVGSASLFFALLLSFVLFQNQSSNMYSGYY